MKFDNDKNPDVTAILIIIMILGALAGIWEIFGK